MICLGGKPDRIISEIYAWVCKHPITGLESIAAIDLNGLDLQAVSSSLEVAKTIGDMLKEMPRPATHKLQLVKFTKTEVIETLGFEKP